MLPQGCESVEDYMVASRVGRGVQLSRVQRKALWPVFAEYRAQLRSANYRELEEAYRDALVLLKKENHAARDSLHRGGRNAGHERGGVVAVACGRAGRTRMTCSWWAMRTSASTGTR